MIRYVLAAVAAAVVVLAAGEAPAQDKLIVPRWRFSYEGVKPGDAATQDQLDELADRIAAKIIERLRAEGDKGGETEFKTTGKVDAGSPKDLVYLSQKCLTCHGGQGAIRGGFRIFLADGKIDPKLDWWKVWDRTTHEDPKLRMPPGGKSPPGKDVADALRNRARGSK